jgi:NADH-quinone oxidoreductase subunit N
MTISMLALAGIPATAGFIGKFYLIDAAVSGGYTWLGVVIVVGSMLSLGYYLPVVAAMWLRPATSDAPGTAAAPGAIPAIAGGSQELDGEAEAPAVAARPAHQPEVVFVAMLAGAATIFFGVIPQPLFDLVSGVGRGFGLF